MKALKKLISIAICLALIVGLVFAVKGVGGEVVYTYATKNRDLPIYSVERQDKAISISFDCAWGVDYTEQILDCLDFYGVKCTFFMTEFWVDKYPDYVKEISNRGHEIGTHSRTHSYMSKLSESEIVSELKTSTEKIEELTGKKVELFRPPYGDYDDLLINTARGMGIYTIQWDVDSLDWKNYSAEKIANRIISKTKSGSIILCHNNGLHTLESLPLIFTELQQKGFVFQPIGELIYKNDFSVRVDGRQIKN